MVSSTCWINVWFSLSIHHPSTFNRESNTIRVLDDKMSFVRYGRACYPIKNAMVPIAKNRGTDGLWGWYLIRDPSAMKALARDVFGNVIAEPTVEIQAAGAPPAEPQDRMFIREGAKSREVKGEEVDLTLAPGLELHIEGSPAGVIIWGPKEGGRQTAWIGIQQGKFTFKGYASKKVAYEEGVFQLYTETWVPGPSPKNEGISGNDLKLTVDAATGVGEIMCYDAKILKLTFDA